MFFFCLGFFRQTCDVAGWNLMLTRQMGEDVFSRYRSQFWRSETLLQDQHFCNPGARIIYNAHSGSCYKVQDRRSNSEIKFSLI